MQTAWPGPGGAQLSGSASHASAGGGGGSGGVSVTGSAPLDAQRHSTLFAAAQAYTDEPPSVEVELDDRRAPACAVSAGARNLRARLMLLRPAVPAEACSVGALQIAKRTRDHRWVIATS